MRDLTFSAVLAGLSMISLVNPFAGLLSWGWIAFALPGSSLWGFAAAIPANFIIAISALTGWVLQTGKPAVSVDRTLILILLLAAFVILSTIFSLSHETSMPKFREYMINFAFLIMIMLCLNTKVRIDTFIWLMVFCIGYYSLKGGLIFLISGGAYRFEGPAGTSIGDNNHLAAAFLLAIPLINYLRIHAATMIVRRGLVALLVLTVLAVFCTQSRGGFIGLLVLAGAFWWMSGRRISHILAGIAIVGLVSGLASSNLVTRLQTLETAHQGDSSLLGRVASWQMHLNAALDRPLVGTGPLAIQTWPVFGRYRPSHSIVDIELHNPIAAHSIYFQVLGDLGFVAFGLYIALLWTAWRNTTWVTRHAADDPSLLWMVNLASMSRVSLLSFAVAGAAVSMPFYDFFMAILVLTACLRRKLEILKTPCGEAKSMFGRRANQLKPHHLLPANR